MYYFDKAGYELMEQDDSIIGVGLEFYCKALNVAVILSRPFHCMCLQCDDENLESYNWALISMFDVLGIAMSVDCERDMREMFLWYQKYQMSEKDCLARKCLV